MSKGFVLVEVSISYIIMAFALMALVPAFIVALRANKQTEKIQAASDLSQELMEEVLLRKWDEASSLTSPGLVNTGTALGIDAGETATDKTTFDDIDDFNGWSESPPQDPMGGALTGFKGFKRTVAVSYTDSNFSVVASTSDYKKVTVCTSAYKLTGVCVDTVVTNH